MDAYNILIVGVGGQGVLFTSEALGEAALESGFNVRVAEVHGMAQRGGSVVCDVRIGERVYSPMIPIGEAHLVIALEPLEALRHVRYVNEETLIAVNVNTVIPPGLIVSGGGYPNLSDIINGLGEVSKNILVIDAFSKAKEAGSPAAQNAVMLGLASASEKLPIPSEVLKKTVTRLVKRRFQDVNRRAFEIGFRSYMEALTSSSLYLTGKP